MRNVFVKIAVAGNILRDPLTKSPLKAEGEWKPANQFWLRRIAAGDVIEQTAAQQKLQADRAVKDKADAASRAAAAQLAADQTPAAPSKSKS